MEIRKIPYKSVLLEIRPRLQCVNVFINLTSSIGNNVDIQLNKDNFEITTNNTIYATIPCKNIEILPNSVSSLKKSDKNISFRFATKNIFSSFTTEFLRNSRSSSYIIDNSTFLLKCIDYKICCSNCGQDLSESLVFERILPLPSENSDSSDWFCHGSTSQAVLNIDPKIQDIFYSHCYCHLSLKLIKNVLINGKIVVCKRCLFWLGLIKNADTIKLWFNTVKFTNRDISHQTNPLDDTFIIIKEVLNNILFNSVRIILNCQSTVNQIDYLLIWILDKELNVNIYNPNGSYQECKVAKVLFKVEEINSEIVKQWDSDVNVVNINISKPMFVQILKHLYKFYKMFPKEFSESNNFYISYLMMYE